MKSSGFKLGPLLIVWRLAVAHAVAKQRKGNHQGVRFFRIGPVLIAWLDKTARARVNKSK